MQATIFQGVYERCSDLLHHRGAFLLEGRVENTPEKGFSSLVERKGPAGGSVRGKDADPEDVDTAFRGLTTGR